MSRKKSQPDEFAAMAEVSRILKPFPEETRERILFTVGMKLKAEQPRKRVRKDKQGANSGVNVVAMEVPRPHLVDAPN